MYQVLKISLSIIDTSMLHFFFFFFIRLSDPKNPRWYMVDVKFERMLKRFIPLSELKALYLKHKQSDGPLKNLALFTAARLSVQPITSGRVFIVLFSLNHFY